jgi:uncharacterized membrane protein YqjE
MAAVDERSIAAVLKDIVGNVQHIVRAEIRLAKIEARHEVDKAKRGVTLLLVGGAVALLALAFVLLACVYVLSGVVAPWIAALIVALGAGGIGVALIAAGTRQMHRVTIAPPKIVATIEENFQWAKTPTA